MSKEAMKLAFEWYDSGNEVHEDFVAMIQSVIALAKQEQGEPVAWRYKPVREDNPRWEYTTQHPLDMGDGYLRPSLVEYCKCIEPLYTTEKPKLMLEKFREMKDLLDEPKQEQGEPVALKVYRGELCYKSQTDDQSFGMWCPVTQDLPFPEGTKFYTTPQQRKPLTYEQFKAKVDEVFGFVVGLGGYEDAIRALYEAAHGIKE